MLLALWAGAGQAHSQEAEKEPAAIVEIGASGESSIKGGEASGGPALAVEFTPIEHWLEVEAGVSPLFSRAGTEWDADVLFKKPYTLSKTVEFMIGAGPTWTHVSERGRTQDSVGAEVALDFMFWPWKGRRIGWFLEPGYGYSFGPGHEQSVGVSAGLLIPLG